MAFVQLSHINVAFGDRDILSDITLNLNEKSRAALAGSNGSGKSTLMKIIAGIFRPDSGTVTSQKGTRTGYLPQDGITYTGKTLFEEADSAFQYLHSVAADIEKTAEELQDTAEKDTKRTELLLEKHHELQEILLKGNYYGRKESIDQVLTGLGFKREDFSKTCGSFSGGWQMRIALAKILLSSPDIILLDEPTNYLDLEARNWLESFLKDFNGGVLLVSHDRHFLDVTVNEILELFGGRLKKYKGNYSEYEIRRKLELESLIERYKRQQDEIEKTEDFINRFRFNASKASLVQSKIKYLERMEKIEIPENLKKIHFSFPDPPHCGTQVLTITNLSKAYGDNVIFRDFSVQFLRGEKTVITGVNGAGKTTLLRIIAGEDRDFTGEVKYGTGVITGYFSQDINRFRNKNHTVIEEMEENAPTHLVPHIRSMLGAFLFRGDDIYKNLSVLSGGEKSRLALLELLLFPSNLLILDEPTNHLDIHSKDILLDALRNYPGTLIFVSHDRYFIEKLATRVIDLTDTGPVDYPGDYDYFLWKKNSRDVSSEREKPSPDINKPSDASAGRLSHIEQKQLKNRINRLKREESEILNSIEKLEEEYSIIEEKLALPENYTDREKANVLKKELDRNLEEQEKLSIKWENIETEIKRLENNG